MLTSHQRSQFQSHGYCVIPGFKSLAQIERLKVAAQQIIDDFDPVSFPTVFTTHADAEEMDAYFLESGDKVRCFLEAEALDQAGKLRLPKSHAINKIGHAMHDLDPEFEAFARDPRLALVAADLGIEQPLLWQSMYIPKSPEIGGEVNWHQDATYFYTTPQTVTTFWFALDDATVDNGCLWVSKRGPAKLKERFSVHEGCAYKQQLDPQPWPDLDDAVPLEVQAGSLVCFSGLLPHYSAPNRSSEPRHAFTLHVTDAGADYAESNWIQRADVRGFV